MNGEKHKKIYEWLKDTWVTDGASICVLEGFPGVGKTYLSQQLGEAVDNDMPTYYVVTTEASIDGLEDIVLSLSKEMELNDDSSLADMINGGGSLIQAFNKVLTKPCLIIIDEFQKAMGESGNNLTGEWKSFLKSTAARPQVKGKILLLSNRTVKNVAWSEQLEVREVSTFSPEDGIAYLGKQLKKYNREDEIAEDKRGAVINLLAGNPRAINLLVSNLTYSSLSELINIADNDWEHDERYLSPDLVGVLEKRLLHNILSNLKEEKQNALFTIAALRKPFNKEMFRFLFSGQADQNDFRKDMIDLFLMEHHRNWFSLNPIAREVGLDFLYNDSARLRTAHETVANYYLRYFQGERVEGQPGKLGAYFMELKYHLTISEDRKTLKEISSKFIGYLSKSLSSVTPIPKSRQGVDELIMLLSVVLEDKGPFELEYLLARLYNHRGKEGDVDKAILHAERALNNKSENYWTLLVNLLLQNGEEEKAIAVLRKGIALPVRGNLSSLFTKCAELLKAKGETQEAIQLLREGIKEIPADKNLFSLYQYCAELLSSAGRGGEAIELLREGIKVIPADKSLGSLYQYCAELLSSEGRVGEAIQLLREGVKVIPADQNLFSLYLYCAELMYADGEPDEAVELLRKGIKDIPPNKGQSIVYSYCAEILWSEGQKQLAFEVLNDGILKTGLTKSNRLLMLNKALYLLKEKDGQGLEDLLIIPGIRKNEEDVIKGFVSILRRNYVTLDELVRQYRTNSSRFHKLDLYAAYTLALLEKNTAAIELIRSKNGRKMGKGRYDCWLMSCLCLFNGDIDAANKEISAYHGRAVRMNPRELKKELFDLWNRKSVPTHKNQVAFNFPLALPIFAEYLAEDDTRRVTTKKNISEPKKSIIMPDIPSNSNQFDVFLCHNSSNKPYIKKIGRQLQGLGLKPWVDEWELIPGRPWQEALEEQIGGIKTAAVFVGPEGIGPWQNREIRAFLSEFNRRGAPVIPVILPSCEKTPELPMFLKQHHYVDFRKTEPDPYRQLVWGITGQKPGESLSPASIKLQSGDTSKSFITEIREIISVELNRVREDIIEKSDASAEKVIAKIDDTSLATANLIISSIEETRIDPDDLKIIMDGIEELRAKPPENSELAIALAGEGEVIEESRMGIDHKLKLTLPIIPLILAYEGEITLNSGLNLTSFIKKLATKLGTGNNRS